MKFRQFATYTQWFLSVLVIFLLASCHSRAPKRPRPSGFSDQAFSDKLETILIPVDTVKKKKVFSMSENMRRTYQIEDHQPIWVKANYVPNNDAQQFLTELEDVRADGLDPEWYNLSALKQLKAKLDANAQRTVDDAIAFDTMLTHSYLAVSHDLLMGYVRPKDVDSLWHHANDSEWTAPQLLADSKEYPSLSNFRSTVPTYAVLRNEYKRYAALASNDTLKNAIAAISVSKRPSAAELRNVYTVINTEMPWLGQSDSAKNGQLITTFQADNGLNPTGKIDSGTYARLSLSVDDILYRLTANMERIRWMQKDFGNLYVIIDVPLMELFLRREGSDVFHMRTVVGRPERQTPTVYAKMEHVIINPSWHVPPTILKKDVLPGLERSGQGYMDKKGLKAYDKSGNVVDPSFIDEGNYKNFTYKQAPGDDNALGYIKFNMPNPWDIYMHDTPHRDDFPKEYRAFSSGCVRLQQPQEMAMYILNDLEKLNYSQGRLDSVISTHNTKWIELKNKIPVHIVYLTAFEDNSKSHALFTRDIYHRDAELIAMLNKAQK